MSSSGLTISMRLADPADYGASYGSWAIDLSTSSLAISRVDGTGRRSFWASLIEVGDKLLIEIPDDKSRQSLIEVDSIIPSDDYVTIGFLFLDEIGKPFNVGETTSITLVKF